jgi:hypothetical protein|tara:strand:+ start:100 stop:264 length:165 start_codon:yes stop_codon:yes gene_type:complete
MVDPTRGLLIHGISTQYYYEIMDLHPDDGKKLIAKMLKLEELTTDELQEISSSR